MDSSITKVILLNTLYALLDNEYPRNIPSSDFASNLPSLSLPLFRMNHLKPKTQ